MSSKLASATQRALPFFAVALAAALWLWPALYNGYPLTFWDTRVYLECAYTLLPRPDRLIGYGLWLRALSWGVTLWPAVIAQCLLVAWLVRRSLHAIAGRVREAYYLALVALLASCTALPFVASQLLADIFTPVLVLALFLLTSNTESSRFERAALLALVALCVCVHLTHLPLGIALWALLCMRAYRAGEAPLGPRLRAPLLALGLGLAASAGFNYARGGRASLASGSDAFLLAHLVESGLAGQILNEHCPERGYLLCPYRARLPMSTDEFLWVDKLDLHPWEQKAAISRELHRLLFDSLREHPLEHVKVALRYTLGALSRFRTGEGLDSDASYLIEPLVRRYVPGDLAAYRAARQQHDALPVAIVNRWHVPIGWALFVLALGLALAGIVARPAPARSVSREFLRFVLAAIVFNAVLSGNLSGVYDRYESRLFWLLGLAIFGEWLAMKNTERLKYK